MQKEAKKEIAAEAELSAKNAAVTGGAPFGATNARATASSPRSPRNGGYSDDPPIANKPRVKFSRAGVTSESESVRLVGADGAREVVVELE